MANIVFNFNILHLYYISSCKKWIILPYSLLLREKYVYNNLYISINVSSKILTYILSTYYPLFII